MKVEEASMEATELEARKRDPQATRATILEAAQELFVQRGFAATSMAGIAHRAGVTKSLIHHHFGSKEELWQGVKRQLMSDWVSAQKRLLTQDDGSGEFLRRSIEGYFRFLQKNPEYVRLSGWMSLEDPMLSEMVYPDLVTLGTERLLREQQRGNVRRDVDVKHVLAMFIALCMHWFLGRNTYNKARLADPQERGADGAYLEDMIKVFMAGIRSVE